MILSSPEAYLPEARLEGQQQEGPHEVEDSYTCDCLPSVFEVHVSGRRAQVCEGRADSVESVAG